MPLPLILPLQGCHDPSLVGGKALGLARLLAAGFPVPAGLCVTTAVYCQTLEAAGFSPTEWWQNAVRRTGEARQRSLREAQVLIRGLDLQALAGACLQEMHQLDGPLSQRWSVRSSATNEDAAHASFAGLYQTELGVAPEHLGRAMTAIWASLWDERVVDYVMKRGSGVAPPAMAIVLQPMLDALSAGVAYSIHPVTGRDNQVTVNAVRGLGALLVDGSVTPDQYVVETEREGRPHRVRRRIEARQSERLVMDADGLRKESLPESVRSRPSLTDSQLFDIARMAKRIERAFQSPVDVEWVIDSKRLWMLQARPITAVRPSPDLTNDECEWSRANFKETMPELPSPLGISFLRRFMERYLIERYRRLGCRIPAGIDSVRVLHGRPYINLSLMHSLVAQLGGDPSLLSEQLGGEALETAPPVQRLGWPSLARAAVRIVGEMRRAEREGPRWFEEMKQLAVACRPQTIRHWSWNQTTARLDELSNWLDHHEITFGIGAAVGQCLQAFGGFMPRWIGSDWRPLFNAALQGQGTVISAQQIVRLAELGRLARQEASVLQWLTADLWQPAEARNMLDGTEFIRAFDRYLNDYGHRGIGESDVMSPRFGDQPESILEVLRTHARSASSTAVSEILARQERVRMEALKEVRRRCGNRLDRRLVFTWWYRRLCRFFGLREANRHHLMYYATAVRHLLLHLGDLSVSRGTFKSREDIFFLTMDEQADLSAGQDRDWQTLVRARQLEREHQASVAVPDMIHDWDSVVEPPVAPVQTDADGPWRGLPIGAGHATGPVRLVRSPDDWNKVQGGDIIVAPVIDPGMAPLFGIAGGLIVEMGGTLSHGAIIAREYGLPTIANIPHAMRRFRDGDRVEVRADSGNVRRIGT
jgi:pyruvate,water dikinase